MRFKKFIEATSDPNFRGYHCRRNEPESDPTFGMMTGDDPEVRNVFENYTSEQHYFRFQKEHGDHPGSWTDAAKADYEKEHKSRPTEKWNEWYDLAADYLNKNGYRILYTSMQVPMSDRIPAIKDHGEHYGPLCYEVYMNETDMLGFYKGGGGENHTESVLVWRVEKPPKLTKIEDFSSWKDWEIDYKY